MAGGERLDQVRQRGVAANAPARPDVTPTTAHVAPASRTSAANASSFRRHPSVVRHGQERDVDLLAIRVYDARMAPPA